MENLGLVVRQLRETRNLPLREVSAALNIDQAIISKLERNQRRATLDQVQKLSSYYKVPIEELLSQWLSDEIASILDGQEIALEALEQARHKIISQAKKSYDRESVFHLIYKVFRKTDYQRIWVFGPYASGQDFFSRTLSVLIEPTAKQKLPTDQHLANLRIKLEKLTRLKIKLFLKDPAAPLSGPMGENNLILIWEKPVTR